MRTKEVKSWDWELMNLEHSIDKVQIIRKPQEMEKMWLEVPYLFESFSSSTFHSCDLATILIFSVKLF